MEPKLTPPRPLHMEVRKCLSCQGPLIRIYGRHGSEGTCSRLCEDRYNREQDEERLRTMGA